MAVSWGLLGVSCFLGVSWGPLRGLLGPPWGLLEVSWGRCGPSWGPPGALSGRKAGFLKCSSPSWALLGGVLEASRAVLGASGAVWERSGAVLGKSWGPPGPAWGVLSGLLGRLAASGSGKGDGRKTVKNIMEINMFPLSGPSSEVSWRARGAFLDSSWSILAVSGAVLDHLGRFGRPLGLSWRRLGALWTRPGDLSRRKP